MLGIGACSKALERLGIEHEIVDAVEIDKYAIESFNAIHNTNFEPQDITKWDKDIEVDLIMHGSPCQDFSVAGLGKGGDEGTGTRSSLMYETIRIVGKLKPKYVIWENVKNLLSQKHRHNFDNYIYQMEELGYNSYYQVLNSKDYGIPQNRERVFTISIRKDINKEYKFPPKEELKLRLKNMLEENVDEKYYLDDVQVERIKTTTYNVGKTRVQEKEYCDTLCARDFKDPKCVQVGNLYGGKWDKINESCRRVYSDDGISPTVQTCQGGNTEPKVAVKRIGGIFDTEEITRQAGGIYDQEGLSPTLSVMQGGWRQPSIMIKNATKQGYIEAEDGDSVNLAANDSMGIVTIGNYMPSNHDASRIVDNSGLAPTVKENHGTVTATNYGLRIRKLTPLECWRLQGFDDEDFYKAKERLNNIFYKGRDNSNSQLYKQAGNSITVNVLEKIFMNLLKE